MNVLIRTGLLAMLPAFPAAAADAVVGNGAPASCTEAAFAAALSTVQGGGGGTVGFDCGGPHAILFTSPRAITAQVVVDGGGLVTLSGGNATRLFTVAAAARLELHDITLSHGYAASGDGGAISSAGALHLAGTTIRNSRTTSEGGSGGAIVSTGPVTAVGSRFENNSAANGGAVYLRFAGAIGTFTDTVFKDNETLSATNGWGGAILLWDGASLTVRHSDLDGNSARLGGAIHNQFANVTLLIDRSLITRNEAVRGGGVYLKGGSLSVSDSTLAANIASQYGGGLLASGGIATLTGSSLVGNRASEGGAISIDSASDALLSMQNCTLHGNTATTIGNGGGAIAALGLAGVLKIDLRHVTLASNVANVGGLDVQTLGSPVELSLVNTALSNNASPTCSLAPSIAAAATARYSLWSDASCTFGTSEQNLPNAEATLGPLADNGGWTDTHAPLPGSLLIDNGLCLPGVATDQRGADRPHGPACDIGSVEAGAVVDAAIFADSFEA